MSAVNPGCDDRRKRWYSLRFPNYRHSRVKGFVLEKHEINLLKFPSWNPNAATLITIFGWPQDGLNFKVFRSSCSYFISKPDVRKIVFQKNDNKCCDCGSINDLQIDHIKSVYHCFRNDLIWFCNTEKNLQTLCFNCNSKKAP